MTHLKNLAYSYADNGYFTELPRIALVKETGTYVPIDGFHRIRSILWLSSEEFLARPDLDLESIAIQYEEYETMADAIIAAAGVNSVHGLKRQKGDIKNAIRALLEVDRTRFMVDKFTLNAEAIMGVVNCSRRTYTQETKEIRQELTDYRDLTVEELSAEGLSVPAIITRTGIAETTVRRILVETPKWQDAKMAENDDLENTPKWQDAQMSQVEELETVPKTQDAQMARNEETVFTQITVVVGMTAMGVNKFLAVHFSHDSESGQNEDQGENFSHDSESVQNLAATPKTQDAQMDDNEDLETGSRTQSAQMSQSKN